MGKKKVITEFVTPNFKEAISLLNANKAKFKRDVRYRNECREVAREYARANQSDPFAYGRALNNLKNGIADPASVKEGSLG